MPVVLPVVRLAISIGLLGVALDWRSPVLAGGRAAALALLIILPVGLVVIETRALRARRVERACGREGGATRQRDIRHPGRGINH